jgi:hypothetical protein
MNPAVEELIRLLPHPAAPEPGRDWASVTQRLAAELPTDYRELVDAFGGGGYIDEYIWLLEPDCPNDNYDLLLSAEERDDSLNYLWESSEERPVQAREEGTRLIPWASTDNGEFLYWLARKDQAPDEWTVMFNEARGEHWEWYDMGCSAFLVGALTGAIRSELFWYKFPLPVHAFVPAAETV